MCMYIYSVCLLLCTVCAQIHHLASFSPHEKGLKMIANKGLSSITAHYKRGKKRIAVIWGKLVKY